MKFILIILILCLAVILPADAERFYWVTTADLDGDGQPEIIAGGQQGPKKSHQGYVVVYKDGKKELTPIAEDVFSVSFEGKTLPTRVRAVVAVQDPGSGQWEIHTSGRGGEDETGIGFLRKTVFNAADKSFRETGTAVFHSPDDSYTHGYPITPVSLAGEKNTCIVYGGFSGGVEKEQPDKADVRVFRTGAGETLEKDFLRPFETLSIPLRVNAVAAGDVDGDGKEDIVIAGRTKTAGGEKPAFACWSDGKIYHQVLTEEDEGRYRSLLIADLDGDGKKEIVTGGRMDVKKVTLARLECWRLEGGVFRFLSRYTWTGDRSTRLRGFARMPGKNVFYVVGRTELVSKKGLLRWRGFIRPFVFAGNRLLPSGEPVYIKRGKETRIRHAVFHKDGRMFIAGFAPKDKTAFCFEAEVNK